MIEIIFHFIAVDVVPYIGVFLEMFHDIPEVFIEGCELLVFQRHFLLDVIAFEDGLEIHPGALALDPAFEGVLDDQQLLLEIVGPFEDGLDEGGRLHHDQDVEVVV